MEEHEKCLDHASNPDGLGYLKDEPACKVCEENWPEYSAECKQKTAEREVPEVVVKKAKKSKSSYLETGTTHKFVKGSARGDVYEWITLGIKDMFNLPTDDEIITKLMESRGMTKKNAARKLWTVKKIVSK